MKLINEYIIEKLKINKDSKVKEFIPKKGIKGLVLRINHGGYNGKQFADTNAPKKTPIDFMLTKDTNYVANCLIDDYDLYFYDSVYCLKAIDEMSAVYKGNGKIKSKDYNFDGYMILKPNTCDSMLDYLDILKLYLIIDNDKH